MNRRVGSTHCCLCGRLLMQPVLLLLTRDDDSPFGDSQCREPRLSAQLIGIAARDPQHLCLFAHRVGDSIHLTLHLPSILLNSPVQWYYSALQSLCQCIKCIFVHCNLFSWFITQDIDFCSPFMYNRIVSCTYQPQNGGKPWIPISSRSA